MNMPFLNFLLRKGMLVSMVGIPFTATANKDEKEGTSAG